MESGLSKLWDRTKVGKPTMAKSPSWTSLVPPKVGAWHIPGYPLIAPPQVWVDFQSAAG